MIAADRDRVSDEVKRDVLETLALDAARAAAEPRAARWDYVLGFEGPLGLVGVEVHPATEGEVDLVIRKKEWAKACLAREMTGGVLSGAGAGSRAGQALFERRRRSTAGLRSLGSSTSGER